VRPPQLIRRLSIIQLDIQVLIHALQRAADADFVLEFDSDFMLYERLEETTTPHVSYEFSKEDEVKDGSLGLCVHSKKMVLIRDGGRKGDFVGVRT
jgi:hypothetical protein